MNPVCDYCGSVSRLVTGKVIYPGSGDSLSKKKFYLCDNGHDRAYVGCHPNSDRPLGRLADAKLRKAKNAAHLAFDPLWKSGKMKRGDAYRWLAESMGLPVAQCHIGMFDVEQCRQVVRVCLARLLKVRPEVEVDMTRLKL